MRRISYILIVLVLISSCGKYDFIDSDQEPKSRSKRELGEQIEEFIKTSEESLKEKLSNEEKKGLNFLKHALIDKKILYSFLILNKNKVKSVLNHIYSELEKCNGNNIKEITFKSTIRNYFYLINENKLDEFQKKIKSDC